MVVAIRPVFQPQGPDTRCKIDGIRLGWVSCTAYAMAMGIDVARGGHRRPSGCAVRRKTIDPQTGTVDTVGGLTLRQVADVALNDFGVRVKVRTGSHAITPEKAAIEIRRGRGFVLQGHTEPLLTTPFKSGDARANHAVWVNEVSGGTREVPKRALVYDPQADGRRAGIDTAPSWWPWELVLEFGAALRPTPGSDRKLGPGKLWAGFIPVPKPGPVVTASAVPAPDFISRFGGRKTTPFPDRTRADPPPGREVNVRRRPRLADANIVDTLRAGELFVAFQKTTRGDKPPGVSSSTWFGNRDGTEWVHESGLSHIGGGT